MSANPEIDSIVTLRPQTNGAGPEAMAPADAAALAPEAPAPESAIAPPYQPLPPLPQVPPWELAPSVVTMPLVTPARARRRPRWLVPAAIAVVGLIASSALGVLLYQTTGQRDAARYQLATTKATLADAQTQLAARKVTDAYLNLYLVNSGRIETDYQTLFVCDSFGSCRSAAQDALTDMKAFQTARAAATVPPAQANADSQLGDALSAAIAADQEVITAMDNNDTTKLDDGYSKFNQAMLSFAKAEAALALTFN